MTRRLSFVLAATLIAAVALAVSPPPPAAADALQCMAQCLRDEGKDEKEKCKLRCADVPTPNMARPGNKDCMAVYKQCKKACQKGDKACRKACKTALTNCV